MYTHSVKFPVAKTWGKESQKKTCHTFVERQVSKMYLSPGRNSVEADVELGAVGGVSVLGVGVGDVEGVLVVAPVGALEAGVQGLLG
jgi:hypothetical protein